MKATLLLLCALGLLGARDSQAAAPGKPGRGFAYERHDLPEGPWSFHVVKVDRSNTNLAFQTTLGVSGRMSLTTLSEQMKNFPRHLGRPVAAVNGDYYRDEGDYEGDPKGLQIMNGELVSAPCGWTSFWIDEKGGLQMTNVQSALEATLPDGSTTPIGLNEERTRSTAVLYTSVVGETSRTSGGTDLVLEMKQPVAPGSIIEARIQAIHPGGDAPITPGTTVLSAGPGINLTGVQAGAVVRLSLKTIPSLAGVTTAMGGGPALIRNGKELPRDEIKVRNPRTAIGWNAAHFYFVQVDGRQLNVSVGATTEELARFLLKLGCTEAMSLDGGGSATTWVFGQVMNRPSEGFERKMANSLVLVQKPK